jgi:hypothetical protein
MRKALIRLALAGLVIACLGALSGSDATAGMPGGLGGALPHQPLATSVRVWKDCQAVAMCTGCRPVYHCRSCSYRRTCKYGMCQWGDVCVWGPYVRILPRGARIIRQ